MKRGLTTEQALQGIQPEPLSKLEWSWLHKASLLAEEQARIRTRLQIADANRYPPGCEEWDEGTWLCHNAGFPPEEMDTMQEPVEARPAICTCEACMRDRSYLALAMATMDKIDAEINAPGFLAQWLGTLTAGHVLTLDDLHRLDRVKQALRSGDKHHAQAREAQNLTAADHIAALVAMGAKLFPKAGPRYADGTAMLILPPEMTNG